MHNCPCHLKSYNRFASESDWNVSCYLQRYTQNLAPWFLMLLVLLCRVRKHHWNCAVFHLFSQIFCIVSCTELKIFSSVSATIILINANLHLIQNYSLEEYTTLLKVGVSKMIVFLLIYSARQIKLIKNDNKKKCSTEIEIYIWPKCSSF